MKKFLLVCCLLLVVVLSSGCVVLDNKTSYAYFDLPSHLSFEQLDRECGSVCYDSGVRIFDMKGKHEVRVVDGVPVCACW